MAAPIERWHGIAGADIVRRESATITDTSTNSDSPYGVLSRNGATIFPRVLFFVNETENISPSSRRPRPLLSITRRGGKDKAPWKDLDLTAITGQTVESCHLFDVHLGETIVPYVTLKPLKALLPLKQGEHSYTGRCQRPGRNSTWWA